MVFLVLIPLIFQVAIPVWLIRRVARPAGGRDLLAWAFDLALALLWIVAVASGGLWLVLPAWLPILWAGLLTVAAASSLAAGSTRAALPQSRAAWRSAGLRAFAVIAVSAAVAGLLSARSIASDPVIDLRFPLEPGSYLVANGGATPFMNGHIRTLSAPRHAAWRGQSYGVDLVGIGRWGSRSSEPFTDGLTDFAIFGARVLAPCAGTVLAALDDLPDMDPGRTDRANLAGNHVIIDCDVAWVLLAHLERGSVQVAPGEPVAPGQVLGRVGNSGNSDEPHLHVHAQRPGDPETPLGGDPLPIRLDGRWPARNARFTGSTR